MRVFQCTVPPCLDGATVETVLRRELKLSPTRIKRTKFLPQGILVDGRRVFTNHVVRTGQEIMVNLPEQEETTLLPTVGAVELLYEDEWLMVVNKPAGVPVHPGPGHYADSLGNYLTWLFQQRGIELVFRPVNRLDIGTSGAMIVAKTAEAHERLQALLHTEQFQREYLALTTRLPEPMTGTVNAPIAAVDGELNKYYVNLSGKDAVTDYTVLGSRDKCVLVQAILHTGRTHQIRVHMAYIGCPLLGDRLYGGDAGLDRPALHSYRISLVHPFTGEQLLVTASVPEDFRVLGWEEVL